MDEQRGSTVVDEKAGDHFTGLVRNDDSSFDPDSTIGVGDTAGTGADTGKPRPGRIDSEHRDAGGAGSAAAGTAAACDAGLTAARRGLEIAAAVAPVRLSQRGLRDGLTRAAALRAHTDRLTINLLAESIRRGETTAGGFRLVDWVMRACPGTAKSHAVDLARVAAAIAADSPTDREAHQPIAQAVGDGDLSVRRASMIVRALDRVRPVVDDETYAADARILLRAATRALFTEADLTRITERLIAAAIPERDHDARDRSAREARAVCESSLAGGALTRFVVIADGEGAGLIRSVMSSPLAAPTPDMEGLPDRRTPAQRRYDALIAILRRGVASPEGQPTTAKAQVVVTMPYDVLAAAVRAREGDIRGDDPSARIPDGFGAGSTASGDLLSPRTVRRLACDADIIPAVLGSENEVLDLGRTHRLVTAGQRRALAFRDQHCSFPGCSIPATWCDAHHIVHWARGGRSDLGNYALLCPRHHTYVHDRDLTASVDPAAEPSLAVRWHTGVPEMAASRH